MYLNFPRLLVPTVFLCMHAFGKASYEVANNVEKVVVAGGPLT